MRRPPEQRGAVSGGGEQPGFDPDPQIASDGSSSLFALRDGGSFAEFGEAFAAEGGLQQIGLEGFDGAPLGLVVLAPDEQVVGLRLGRRGLCLGVVAEGAPQGFDGPVESDQAQAGVAGETQCLPVFRGVGEQVVNAERGGVRCVESGA